MRDTRKRDWLCVKCSTVAPKGVVWPPISADEKRAWKEFINHPCTPTRKPRKARQ